ncbi:unnamed protein product, partial [Rotaria sp. Silwood1]
MNNLTFLAGDFDT